jgi:hypothetical protein
MLPENQNSEITALKNQVFTLLVALIVVSGTLTVYLYRQSSQIGKDMAALEEQAKNLAPALNQNEVAVTTFVTKLMAYGQKHPDFMPVLKKYNLTAVTPGAAPLTPANPLVAPKK